MLDSSLIINFRILNITLTLNVGRSNCKRKKIPIYLFVLGATATIFLGINALRNKELLSQLSSAASSFRRQTCAEK